MTAQDTQPEAPLTVVQICGAGHSGSTLLGLVLGSHSDAAYLGEAKKARFVGDPRKPARKRACKFCGDERCPVWGGFRWRDDANMYETMAQRTGRRVLIDSTKGLSWLTQRAQESNTRGHRRVLLFLQRDGRAVINSRLRKYPERDLAGQIDQWVEQIEATRAFYDAERSDKAIVRYEEFATAPQAVAQRLCQLIGVPYEPAMLRFDEREHHVLGGNNGTQFLATRDRATAERVQPGARHGAYYREHERGIRLDLRWRHELPAAALERFEARAGHLNKDMVWEVP